MYTENGNGGRPRCAGRKKDGDRCENAPLLGGEFCRWHQEEVDSVYTNGNVTTRGIRDELRYIADENSNRIATALLEIAESAQKKNEHVEGACRKCGTRQRFPVPFPDYSARVKAIETLVALGYGRVKEEALARDRPFKDAAARAHVDVSKLTPEEQDSYFTELFIESASDDLKLAVMAALDAEQMGQDAARELWEDTWRAAEEPRRLRRTAGL